MEYDNRKWLTVEREMLKEKEVCKNEKRLVVVVVVVMMVVMVVRV